MTIAEKLELVATKQQDVYNAGYNKGVAQGGSSVPEDKIVRKTKESWGACAHLYDISEFSHTITVQLQNDTISNFSNITVMMKGKNLLTDEFICGHQLYGAVDGMTETRPSSVDAYLIINASPGTSYTVSLDNSVYRIYRICESDINETMLVNHSLYTSTDKDTPSYSFLTHNDTKRIWLGIRNKTGDATLESIAQTRIQLEANSTATEYEVPILVSFKSQENGINTFESKKMIAEFSTDDLNTTLLVSYNQSYGMHESWSQLWDIIQASGTKSAYSGGSFSGSWNEINFKPKYNIVPKNSSLSSVFANSWIGNLSKILDEQNVILDTSQSTNLSYSFQGSKTTQIPAIDASNATNLAYIFYGCQNLFSVKKLIIPETVTNLTNAFFQCYQLKSIVLEGNVAASLSFQHSKKLNRASIESIITALSSSKTGLTLTLSAAAVKTAFNTTDPSTSVDWNDLIGTKSNWTISLV